MPIRTPRTALHLCIFTSRNNAAQRRGDRMKSRLFSVVLLLFVAIGSFQECLGQIPSPEKHISSKSVQHFREWSRNRSVRFSNSPAQSNKYLNPRPYLKPPPTAVSFLAATQIGADGATNYRAVSGDVNGDKLPDAITIVDNSASPTGTYLVVLPGTGNGMFNAPILTPVSFGANHFILVADVNEDGKDDVILVHPNSMDVLISIGDGTFAAPQTMATGIASPIAAGSWDVNHDGILDLAVVDGSSQQAAFLVGDGNGNFSPPQITSFPAQASAGVLADVDRDGNLDLVTNTAFYPGDGTGGFLPAVPLQSNDGQNAGAVFSDSVAVGDVNGDGLPDVVTVNGYWNTVSVFLNQGSRQLVQQGVSVWTGNNPIAVTLADTNWDGKADLIVTNAAQSDLTVLLGKGDGTFFPPTPGYAIGGSPSTKAVLADFYGDGNLDALVSDNRSSVVLARGFGDGTFQAAPDSGIVAPPGWSSSGGAFSIAAADLNGDGVPDFVVGQSSASPGLGLVVFLTQSDGSLGQGVVYAQNDALSYVALGDINQDGKVDIVASNWATGSAEILLGNGNGTFQSPVSIPLPAITNGVVVGDFNGDGWPDVALAGQDSSVYVLLNDGHGSMVPAGNYPLSGTGYELVAADVNKDGKLDLCVAMTSTSRAAILLGNGDGTFSAAPDFDTTLPSPYGIAAGDLDQDGNPDLVISSPASGSVMIAFGNGDGSFIAPIIYGASLLSSQVNPSPGEVTLSDVNKDGNLDIVYANSGYSSAGVLLGDGVGNFFGPAEFPVGGGSLAVAIADLNKDSWPDIVTADVNFSGVSVLYNTSASQPAPDFTIAANPLPVLVAPGGTATAAISLMSTNGFSGSVQLECQNLPNTLSCTFTPNVLHLVKGKGASSQLTIAAAQSNTAALSSGPELMVLAVVPIIGGMFFWRAPRVTGKAALLALVASLMLFSGCQSLAPKKIGQTYTITVKAVAWNGTSHSVQMQVTVQR